jgi:hypothetical protein
MQRKQFPKIFFLFFVFAFNLTACYRFPNEDEYSVVPATNNPAVTREKSEGNFMPNMGF